MSYSERVEENDSFDPEETPDIRDEGILDAEEIDSDIDKKESELAVFEKVHIENKKSSSNEKIYEPKRKNGSGDDLAISLDAYLQSVAREETEDMLQDDEFLREQTRIPKLIHDMITLYSNEIIFPRMEKLLGIGERKSNRMSIVAIFLGFAALFLGIGSFYLLDSFIGLFLQLLVSGTLVLIGIVLTITAISDILDQRNQ